MNTRHSHVCVGPLYFTIRLFGSWRLIIEVLYLGIHISQILYRVVLGFFWISVSDKAGNYVWSDGPLCLWNVLGTLWWSLFVMSAVVHLALTGLVLFVMNICSASCIDNVAHAWWANVVQPMSWGMHAEHPALTVCPNLWSAHMV